MSEHTFDDTDEAPIATSTRVPPEPTPEPSDDEASAEDADETPIPTRTRSA